MTPLTQLSNKEYVALVAKAQEAEDLRKQLFRIREAVDAVLTNEEHAVSGGMRKYQIGSPTWEAYENLRQSTYPPSGGTDLPLRKTVVVPTADGVKSTVEIRKDYLGMFAELMTEASETLYKMTPAVAESVGLRFPLIDELDGAALMALAATKSISEVPVQSPKPVEYRRPR